MMRYIIILIMVFTVSLSAQIMGFLDNFEDGSLDTLWNDELHILWDTEDYGIFHLSEQNGELNIEYTRTTDDRPWPCMYFTPPEVIDVTVTPEIAIKIKTGLNTMIYGIIPMSLTVPHCNR